MTDVLGWTVLIGLLTPLSISLETGAQRGFVSTIVAQAPGRPEIERPPDDNGRAVFLLPSGVAWTIACKGRGVWCPTVPVPSPQPERIEIPVFPAVEVRGLLRAPLGRVAPAQAQLQGWFYERDRDRKFALEVPISLDAPLALQGPTKRRFAFVAPAGGALDLRVAPDGWSPIYRWGLHVQAGKPLDLGTMDLMRGASLSGVVLSEGSLRPVPGAAVRIGPVRGSLGASMVDVERGSRQSRSTVSGSTGFFQLAGLPAGDYRLEIESSDNGLAPAIVEPVSLGEDSETDMSELLLRRLVSLTVSVIPSHAPDGTPWTVEVLPLGAETEASSQITDQGGSVTILRVPQRRCRLAILDSQSRRVAVRHVDPREGEVTEIDLDLVRARGKATLNGDPLVAELRFSIGEGDEFVMHSDALGGFEGWMQRPRHGRVAVHVIGALPRFEQRAELPVTPSKGSDLLLDIALRGTAVRGVVVDDAGSPAWGAQVLAIPGVEPALRAVARDDGRFEFEMLAEGTYQFLAEHADIGSSDAHSVSVGDNLVPELSLILRPRKTVQGVLRTVSGVPLSGARVAVETPPPSASVVTAVTDLNGHFVLRIPEDLERAVVQVKVPHRLLWSTCAEFSSAALVLQVPEGVGTLTLDLGVGPGRQVVVATSEGGMFTANALLQWLWEAQPGAAGSVPDGAVAVPLVATGSYGSVSVAMPSWNLVSAACARGLVPAATLQFLPAGGELRLSASP